MQFRRNGLRDERRRRALMEDRAGEDARRFTSDSAGIGATAPPRTYSKSAIDERRVRIVDAVPLYAIHVAIFYAGTVLLVAGLLALHHYIGGLIRWADLARVDSLGTWIASGTLLLGTLTAVLIFRIRRHRLDDYRGRYRCWLWFAGLLLFASLDTVLNFRSDVASGLESLTQMRLLARTDAWWAAVWTVAFGAMAVRAALEVRESRGTLVVGALSATLLATGMGLQLDLLLLPQNVSAELVLHSARLGGLGLLMAALVQYARYVWLDAQGLIVRKSTLATAAESDSEPAQAAKARAPRRATKKPAKNKPVVTSDEENEGENGEDAEPVRLRGWFSFGRKKSAEDSSADEGDDSSSEAKSARVKRPAARKAAQVTDTKGKGNEETQEDAKPKRRWFPWGSKEAAVDDPDEGQNDESVAKTTAKTSRPLSRKVAARSASEDEADEADAATSAKRSWFSFGRKQAADGDAAEEKATSAKPKQSAAKAAEPEDAAEKAPRKSWFGWGKQAAAEDESADEVEATRKTMTPRITTRPKGSGPAPAATPPAASPPTITGKYSSRDEDAEYGNDSNDDGSDSGDEEILRLEAKPEHLLSKAERRRLKKLKRRAA